MKAISNSIEFKSQSRINVLRIYKSIQSSKNQNPPRYKSERDFIKSNRYF